MSFTNEEDLKRQILSGLKVAVESTVDEIHERNEDFIDNVVYDSYDPSWYDRTWDFKNAWDTTIGSAGSYVEGKFYYNSNGMTVGPQETGQHVSVVTGEPVAGYMPEIIYQGKMGAIYRPTKRDAWKALDKFLTNTQMRSMFESGLNKSGLPWKKSRGAIKVQKWV